nr:transmembrane protein adipocyte-associated 1 homolog [Tanacetum cinerariifolium]
MSEDLIGTIPAITDIHHATSSPPSLSLSPLDQSNCGYGLWYTCVLSIPAVIFVVYLGFHLKKNIKKLRHRKSHVMITYYLLLCFSAILNLAWSALQPLSCQKKLSPTLSFRNQSSPTLNCLSAESLEKAVAIAELPESAAAYTKLLIVKLVHIYLLGGRDEPQTEKLLLVIVLREIVTADKKRKSRQSTIESGAKQE